MEIWITILLVVCLASVVQGVAGFGFGIVTISMIPLVLGFRDSISLMTLLMVAVSIMMFFRTRREFNWKDCKNIIPGLVLGVPIGVYIVVVVDEALILKIFGVINIIIGLHYLLYNRRKGKAIPEVFAFPVGLSGGLLAGAFNMGGPPLIAYLYSRPWDLDRIKSVMSTAFLATTFLRLPFVGLTAERVDLVLLLFLAALVPIWIFMNFGFSLARKFTAQGLRNAVYTYLTLIGCYYLFIH